MLSDARKDHLGWTGFFVVNAKFEARADLWDHADKWCTERWGAPNRQGRWYRTNAWFMFRDPSDALMFKLSWEFNP